LMPATIERSHSLVASTLNPRCVVPSGHRDPGAGENHDVYVEVSGPATMDVHHNFVERWNGASERTGDDGMWGDRAAGDLPRVFPEPRRRGRSVLQIQRTMPTRSPGSGVRDGRSGATSIFEQYRRAFAVAERSIYIENQALDVPVVLRWIRRALEQGVEVVAVVPIVPDSLGSDRQLSLKAFLALAGFDNFTLAGLAASCGDGERRDIYVHSKLMLVDDQWATIGFATSTPGRCSATLR
jgi:cardiolipin synthase A/B